MLTTFVTVTSESNGEYRGFRGPPLHRIRRTLRFGSRSSDRRVRARGASSVLASEWTPGLHAPAGDRHVHPDTEDTVGRGV